MPYAATRVLCIDIGTQYVPAVKPLADICELLKQCQKVHTEKKTFRKKMIFFLLFAAGIYWVPISTDRNRQCRAEKLAVEAFFFAPNELKNGVPVR